MSFWDQAQMSDYDYHVDRSDDPPVLVIVDLNRGGKSVTNNIEAIIRSICDELDALPGAIVYRDSEGIYDGYDTITNCFIALNCTNEREAVAAARQR